MPICQAKLRSGDPCTKHVEHGQLFCKWHNPDDQTWRDDYRRLDEASPEERTIIVLALIEDHPDHILYLPIRGDIRANLSNIDLSSERLRGNILQTILNNTQRVFPITGGMDLSDSNLQGALISSANLQGANFDHANLSGADLEFSNLRDTFLTQTNLQYTGLRWAEMQNACLINAECKEAFLHGANLQGALVYKSNLEKVVLTEANLQGTRLDDTNLKGGYLCMANLRGNDLRWAKISGVFLSEVDLDRTKIKHSQIIDGIGEEKECNYGSAAQAYMILKQNFEGLGDYDGASWAYRKERCMEKLEALERSKISFKENKWKEAITNFWKYIGDDFIEWLCDYGEGVQRVLGWTAFLLFILGPVLFSLLGKNEFGNPSYLLLLTYTLDTMTTANFSGIQPESQGLKLASGVFAFSGIFLAGLLGFVVGNRIRRS